MEWRDEGIVTGLRRLGESGVIAEVFTHNHGRHLGVVRSGRSRRMQPVLQPGNSVTLVWRARIEESLGTFAVEGGEMRGAALLASPLALHGVNWIAALIRLLPERDPHPALYEIVATILNHLQDRDIGPALLVRLEIALLTELGFGLDLESCAATGETDDLIYVSPKSGRAVSRQAGAPWADRLLRLPAFLRPVGQFAGPDAGDILDGFRLTEFFLDRDVFRPRNLPMPEPRRALIREITLHAPPLAGVKASSAITGNVA